MACRPRPAGTDGLEPSAYACGLAEENVCGRVSLEQVGRALAAYYEQEHAVWGAPPHAEEADMVSHRIVELFEEGSFALVSLSATRARLSRGLDDALLQPVSFKDE